MTVAKLLEQQHRGGQQRQRERNLRRRPRRCAMRVWRRPCRSPPRLPSRDAVARSVLQACDGRQQRSRECRRRSGPRRGHEHTTLSTAMLSTRGQCWAARAGRNTRTAIAARVTPSGAADGQERDDLGDALQRSRAAARRQAPGAPSSSRLRAAALRGQQSCEIQRRHEQQATRRRRASRRAPARTSPSRLACRLITSTPTSLFIGYRAASRAAIDVHLALRLRDGHARFEPRDAAQAEWPAPCA